MYGVGGWDKEIYMTLKEKDIRMKRKMWATGLYKTNDNGPGPTHGIVAIAMINCHDRSTWNVQLEGRACQIRGLDGSGAH